MSDLAKFVPGIDIIGQNLFNVGRMIFSVNDIGSYFDFLLNIGVLGGLLVSIIGSFAALAVFYFLAEIYEIVLYFLLRKQLFKK